MSEFSCRQDVFCPFPSIGFRKKAFFALLEMTGSLDIGLERAKDGAEQQLPLSAKCCLNSARMLEAESE